jgi:DNA helicase-2/ATP-dependent DNA helicase PcrA
MTTVTRTGLVDLLGVDLTGAQWDAVSAPLSPGLIVAGAGSGKTTVMAARVIYLVTSGQVAPGQVLGLTFTTKAAGELAARVRRALERARGLEPSTVAGNPADDEPTVSTYHAYAGRLLAEHGLRLGLEPEARLLADASRYQLAGRVVHRARGPFPALTWTAGTVLARVVALEGQLQEHLVEPGELRAHDAKVAAEVTAQLRAATLQRDRAPLSKILAAAAARQELLTLVEGYRQAKRAIDAVDFGDQMAFGARLAEECQEVGAAERSTFRVVLLDEYQDTSVTQRRMLAALFGGGHGVTAVGDPCQAIYGWRGASVANLDGFPTHFPAADGRPALRYPLTVNQRSGGHLLAAANGVAQKLRARHDVAELEPRAGAGEAGRCVVGLFDTWPQELAWMASEVGLALTADPTLGPRDAAVLVRVRRDMPAVHSALLAAGLPVEVVGLGGLLSVPAVADVHATLSVLDDPTANAALLRLLGGPRWRIGRRDLQALGRRAAALVSAHRDDGRDWEEQVGAVDPTEAVSLSDALGDPGPGPYSPEARARFAAAAAELCDLRRHVGEPLLDVVHRVVTSSGLDVELAASPEALISRGGDQLAAFTDHAATFTDLDGQSGLSAFLAFLAAAEDHDQGLSAACPSDVDAVKLMTVHQAKGLEWAVVALPNLTASVFPVTSARDRWVNSGHILPAPLRGDFLAADGTPGLPAPDAWSPADLVGYFAEESQAQETEELRLAYVAVTRAKDVLVGSSHWWGPTQKLPRGPSPVLEALAHHVRQCPEAGRISQWAAQPAGSENPCLGDDGPALSWPAPGDESARALRGAAAQAVREALHAQSPPEGVEGLCAADRALVASWDRDIELLLAEASTVEERRLVVDLPAALTASQLVLLRRDPARLAGELARPMPRAPAPAATLGTRFHAWVEERFSLRPLLDADDLPGAGDADVGDPGGAALAELQQAFRDSGWADRVPVEVEAPFDLVVGGHVVRGRIDAVYRTEAGGWHVVDWKTGREASDPLQLAIYRLAWARLRGVPPESVRASFFPVRTGKLVDPPDLPGEAELLALLEGGSVPPEER